MLKSEMGKDARGGIEEIRHAMRGEGSNWKLGETRNVTDRYIFLKTFFLTFPWTSSFMKTPIRLTVLALSLFALKNLCQMGESTWNWIIFLQSLRIERYKPNLSSPHVASRNLVQLCLQLISQKYIQIDQYLTPSIVQLFVVRSPAEPGLSAACSEHSTSSSDSVQMISK